MSHGSANAAAQTTVNVLVSPAPAPTATAAASPCPTAYPLPSVPATVDWLGHVTASLFPWAFVVLVVLLVAGLVLRRSPKTRDVLLSLLNRTSKVGISTTGATVELTPENAKQLEVQANQVLQTVDAYGDQVNAGLQRLVSELQMTDRLGHYVRAIIPEPRPKGFRSTLYIADPLWMGFLNQLTEYYPFQGGGKAGRRFSVRYGIIGQAWRTEKPILVGRWLKDGVPEDKLDRAKLVQYIAENWGLTPEEADHVAEKPSYAAFPIMFEGTIKGLFFMDSDEENAFGAAREGEANLKSFTDKLRDSDIPAKLAELVKRIEPFALRLDVEKRGKS